MKSGSKIIEIQKYENNLKHSKNILHSDFFNFFFLQISMPRKMKFDKEVIFNMFKFANNSFDLLLTLFLKL